LPGQPLRCRPCFDGSSSVHARRLRCGVGRVEGPGITARRLQGLTGLCSPLLSARRSLTRVVGVSVGVVRVAASAGVGRAAWPLPLPVARDATESTVIGSQVASACA
jgi:hypothetical protein